MRKVSKKICLLGDFAVGKTSLVRRYVYNRFDDKYISTIGVKVSRKTVTVPQNNDELVEITIMLWDLAGSEEFDQVRASYLRGAAGAVLVCDLTRADTLGNLINYANDFSRVNSVSNLIVAANKNDLTDQHEIKKGQVEAVAAQLKATFYLTSAKTGDEVEALFRQLGHLLVV